MGTAAGMEENRQNPHWSSVFSLLIPWLPFSYIHWRRLAAAFKQNVLTASSVCSQPPLSFLRSAGLLLLLSRAKVPEEHGDGLFDTWEMNTDLVLQIMSGCHVH